MPLQTPGPVALIFTEPSTRTRISFAEAVHRMGGWTRDLGETGSSLDKGETMEETILNLSAMDFSGVVIRTPIKGLPEEQRALDPSLWIVNAGDGDGEHPTQALGDTFTLMAHGGVEGRRIALVGDVAHSRVAHSLLALWPKLGVQIGVYPHGEGTVDGADTLFSTLEEASEWAEVLYLLRPQVERWAKPLSGKALQKEMAPWRVDTIRPGQFLMAPGPTLPGVDIAKGLLLDSASLILDQVRWGLAGRMALIEELSLG